MKTKVFTAYYRKLNLLEREMNRFFKQTEFIDIITIKQNTIHDTVIVTVVYISEEKQEKNIVLEKPKKLETEKLLTNG